MAKQIINEAERKTGGRGGEGCCNTFDKAWMHFYVERTKNKDDYCNKKCKDITWRNTNENMYKNVEFNGIIEIQADWQKSISTKWGCGRQVVNDSLGLPIINWHYWYHCWKVHTSQPIILTGNLSWGYIPRQISFIGFYIHSDLQTWVYVFLSWLNKTSGEGVLRELLAASQFLSEFFLRMPSWPRLWAGS